MNPITEIYETLKLRSDKWIPYFDVYHHYFDKFRHESPTVVEVGVYGGGSIEAWVKYFGPSASIFGIDNFPIIERVEGANLVIGDQGDPDFWDAFLTQVPVIDCFIDDGSHVMEHQILTFMKVWPHISEGGVYICEDTHTSYWEDHNGGFGKSNTFMEFTKQLLDGLQMDFIPNAQPNEQFRDFVRSIGFVGYYQSQVVITKTRKDFKRIITNFNDEIKPNE